MASYGAKQLEDRIKNAIWDEVNDSELIKEAISENISDIDLSEYVDVDDEVEKAVENKIDAILSSEKIDKVVAERLDISSLIRAVMNTDTFKEVLRSEVKKEFDSLWI